MFHRIFPSVSVEFDGRHNIPMDTARVVVAEISSDEHDDSDEEVVGELCARGKRIFVFREKFFESELGRVRQVWHTILSRNQIIETGENRENARQSQAKT
jgi:hypothetical protein